MRSDETKHNDLRAKVGLNGFVIMRMRLIVFMS